MKKIKEIELAYSEQGTSEERILWIHGYTMNSSVWKDLWNELPQFHHFGLDLPGHGDSRDLSLKEDLGLLAKSIGKWAIDNEIRHIAGISLGGLLAIQILIEYPNQFRTLLLNSSALGGGPVNSYAQQKNQELRRLFSEKGVGKWMREAWMNWPPDIFKGASENESLWTQLVEMIDNHRWIEMGNGSMLTFHKHMQRVPQLRKIQASTLIAIGENDMDTFLRTGEMIRRSIPNSTRLYCKGCGHLAWLENPQSGAEMISKFISELENNIDNTKKLEYESH